MEILFLILCSNIEKSSEQVDCPDNFTRSFCAKPKQKVKFNDS